MSSRYVATCSVYLGMSMGVLHMQQSLAGLQVAPAMCTIFTCQLHLPTSPANFTAPAFHLAILQPLATSETQPLATPCGPWCTSHAPGIIHLPCPASLPQVYFNDSAAEAKEYTTQVLGKWTDLLASLPDEDRAKLQRAMGLKMEQLKVSDRAAGAPVRQLL